MRRSPLKRRGSLTVVGIGYRAAAQLTPEVLASIQSSEKLYYLVYDPLTEAWIRESHHNSRSLAECWTPGESVDQCCDKMVDVIITAVRAGMNVCVAFSGHPTICVYPTSESLRLARREGFKTQVFPGISAMDCLFADLGIDPGMGGCQLWEARTLLVRRPKLNRSTNLVLLQIELIGKNVEYGRSALDGLRILRDFLCRFYPRNHAAAVYEAATFPTADPIVEWVALANLPEARVTALSTLLVPPASNRQLHGCGRP